MGLMQSLFLVLGGRLKNFDSLEFEDTSKLDVVGVYSDQQTALAAWRSKSQQTVDDALMRYFVLPLHNLIKS